MATIRYYRDECRRRGMAGFTIAETTVVVAIIAVLAAVAVPSLNEYLRNARVSAQATELMSDLAFARSESITRGRRVTVCVSTDNETCASSGTPWSSGRVVFLDANGNGTVDGSDTRIRIGATVTSDTTISAVSGTTNFSRITFFPYGGVNSAGEFSICVAGWTNGRRVAVAATGRATTSRFTCES